MQCVKWAPWDVDRDGEGTVDMNMDMDGDRFSDTIGSSEFTAETKGETKSRETKGRGTTGETKNGVYHSPPSSSRGVVEGGVRVGVRDQRYLAGDSRFEVHRVPRRLVTVLSASELSASEVTGASATNVNREEEGVADDDVELSPPSLS